MITWPIVAIVLIAAIMFTVLIVTGNASAVTMATTALGAVALAIAHAFIVRGVESARASKRAREAMDAQQPPPSDGNIP